MRWPSGTRALLEEARDRPVRNPRDYDIERRLADLLEAMPAVGVSTDGA
jgi:hypothetical protein